MLLIPQSRRGLIQRPANAGARNFLVPNVPPLGAIPNSFGDPIELASLNLDSAIYRNDLNSVIASTKSALASGGISIQVYAFVFGGCDFRVLGSAVQIWLSLT